MPPVVVDASVLVAVVLDTGSDGDWARGVLAEAYLIAPEMAPAEVGSVLRRAELAGEISGIEATAGYREVIRLSIELLSFEPFAGRIWDLRANVTVYDAWYVACAEALATPLATLDARLRRAPGPTCAFLSPNTPAATTDERS